MRIPIRVIAADKRAGSLREFLLSGFAAGLAAQMLITYAHCEAAAFVPLPSSALKQCSPVKPGHYVSYHLPAVARLPVGVSFATDWDSVPTGGWYGRQEMDDCRIRPDGRLTWHNRPTIRVEVQPKDDPLDLGANSERAEMSIMQDADKKEIYENTSSGVQYYATSYLFPATWQGEQLPWSAFAPSDCSQQNQNLCNSWSFVWQFYGWGGLSAARHVADGPEQFLFNNSEFATDGLINLGKWTDFIFMVDWRTGAYKIWRRDEDHAMFTQVLKGQTPVPPGRNIYVKQGLYRGGNVNGRVDVLWIGPTVRGSSFVAVEREAFGTDGGSVEE